MTWLLWGASPLIASAAQLVSGVGLSTLNIFISGFMPLVIVVASFRNKEAYWRIGIFDYACGAVAILALVLWAVTDNPVQAVLWSIVSDFLAGLPTLKKCYTHPESESRHTYLIGAIANSFGVLSVTHHTFVGYAFQIFLCGIIWVYVGLLYRNDAGRWATRMFLKKA